MIEVLREYWRMFLAVVFVFIGGIFVYLSNGSTADAEYEAQILESEISELQAELAKDSLTEEDFQSDVEYIETSGSHARDMGAEMIDVQLKLADAYRTHEPVVDYEDQEGLEEAETAFTRLTGLTDYVNTWVLNPAWSMELDSVGTYVDGENIPVVFSMYVENGDLAGIVRGTYDSERDLLEDIQVDHTVAGQSDAVDIGGR